MKIVLMMVLYSLFATIAIAQQPDTVTAKLTQLRKAKRVTEKYVNFDDLKFLTIGHGDNTFGVNHGTGLSIGMQLLSPYALFKNTPIPIAWGVTLGYNKMTFPRTRLVFSGNELTAIESSKEINSTVQRTSHLGFIAMLVKQWKVTGITFMGGASADYNLISRLRIRKDSGNKGIASGKFINRFSLPIHLQISWSKKQFFSIGVFGSYDTKPRFKGPAFTGLKQIVAGACLAFII